MTEMYEDMVEVFGRTDREMRLINKMLREMITI